VPTAVAGKWNILYVDDEARNLDAFSRAFADADFVAQIFTTTSPREALTILDKAEIAAIVTDQRMPEMSGTELLAAVLARHPEPVRVIVTAYTEVRDILDAINRGHVYFYVTKPWDPDEMRLVLRRAVEHYATVRELADRNRELRSAYHDLEEAHNEQMRLYEMVITDEKTGVRNYHYFRLRLGEEFERARRYGGELSVLMVDIDDFKRVNDQHGHLVGDTVLRDVAQILVEGQRAVDIVARYGGEEFVVILPETPRAGACAIAERVRERIASHTFLGGGGAPLHVTVSIGVAGFPHPMVTGKEELIQRADRALYRAKAQGKNRIHDEG
jgi:diguanylate cyclase (GGDEF)-like protein